MKANLSAVNSKKPLRKATHNHNKVIFLNIRLLSPSKFHQLLLIWKASFARSYDISDVQGAKSTKTVVFGKFPRQLLLDSLAVKCLIFY